MTDREKLHEWLVDSITATLLGYLSDGEWAVEEIAGDVAQALLRLPLNPDNLVSLLRLIGELDRECDGWGCIDGQIQDVNGAWMDCFKCDGSGRVRVSPDEIIEALVKAGVLDVVASAGALIICPDDLDSDADLYVTGWRPEPAVARSQGEPDDQWPRVGSS